MKVALLSDCYPPRLGGIESQVRDLGQQLLEAGHHVEVFTATAGSTGQRHGVVEADAGVPVHRLALRVPFGLPVNPFAPSEVRRRLDAGGFDVAHVHMGVVSPFATDMANVTTGLGLPTAITWHCVLGAGSAAVLARLGHARRWVRAGAALSAVSAMGAARVAGLVDSGGRISVLPNGIDVARWRPAAGDAVLEGDNTFRVVAALRLAPRKRALPLLRILADARRRVPADIPMSATIFGDGPLRPIVEREITRRDLGWITLAGRVTRPELADAYAASHAFVSPTRLEAFGIAALEARTAGLPVVAVAGSGVEDFVREGIEGLFGATDKDLAAAVTRLATDRGLREQIREHNTVVAPTQAWPTVIEKVLAEYRRAGTRQP